MSFKDHHQYYKGRNQLRAAALALITAEQDRVIPSFDTVHCPRMPHTNQPMPHFWKVLTQPRLEPRTFHFHGRCPNHWATGLGWLINVKSEMAWWLSPSWLTTASQSLLTGNTQLHQDVQSKTKSIPSFDTVHCPRMPHANQPMPQFLKSVDPAGTWTQDLPLLRQML